MTSLGKSHKKTQRGFSIFMLTLLIAGGVNARTDGGVIINEIANAGGKYVELLVTKPGGVRLAGWFLTNFSSPDDKRKERGFIRFSDRDSSVFHRTIPEGTYILLCLGTREELYGGSKMTEDVSLDDGNNRIVVFVNFSPAHIERSKSALTLFAKDNLALLYEWKKEGAMAIVTWGGKSLWTGCKPVQLPAANLETARVAYFAPKGLSENNLAHYTDPKLWISSGDLKNATPGQKNPGVD